MTRSVKEQLGVALVVLGGILAIAAGIIFVMAMLFPAESSQVGLGLGTLVSGVRDQIDALTTLTGLSLGADLLLLFSAYVIVCLCLWIQTEVRSYLGNRSHFE